MKRLLVSIITALSVVIGTSGAMAAANANVEVKNDVKSVTYSYTALAGTRAENQITKLFEDIKKLNSENPNYSEDITIISKSADGLAVDFSLKMEDKTSGGSSEDNTILSLCSVKIKDADGNDVTGTDSANITTDGDKAVIELPLGRQNTQFTKDEKKKDIGGIFLGFAILMYGMEAMSGAVAPLADNEKFTGILTMFSNPILGLLAGTILTAVIQSSSASVGILQALCATGAVNFSTALPIIMGQNIGTCVTAIISSIGTSKNAKRAAAVHLFFNISGTVIFMVVFYTLNTFVHFSFLNTAASPAGIAVIHSLFNIGATILLFPFANLLEKMAILAIPDKGSEVEEMEEEKINPDLARLDERFLDKPGFAMEECRGVAINMARKSKKAMNLAIDLLKEYDEKTSARVEKLENQIDQYEDALGTYLVKLSERDLSVKDSRILSVLLHCIGDFERISDHAVNIRDAAVEMNKKNLQFSDKAKQELLVFSNAIRDIIDRAVLAFETGDTGLAKEVEPLEQVVDALNKEEKQRHINRLRTGTCTIELGFVLSDISTNFERAADHCSNIAVCLLQVDEGGFDTHEYLDILKEENSEEFRHEYMELSEKYALPESKHGGK